MAVFTSEPKAAAFFTLNKTTSKKTTNYIKRMTLTYNYSRSIPRSKDYTLTVNGITVDALESDLATYAICAVPQGSVEIAIQSNDKLIIAPTVHPLRLAVQATATESTVRFTLDKAQNLLVKIPGLPDFYLFIHNTKEVLPVDKGNTLLIKEGEIYEAELHDLADYDTLHIQGGGVFRGHLHVRNKKGIRITGHGIFDGSLYSVEIDGHSPSLVLDHCSDVIVEDITMINPSGWMLLLGACNGAQVRNLKQLGKVMCSDGIDVVGSSNVLIEDCLLSNNDDCVVVKAFLVRNKRLNYTYCDGRVNVDNVLVRRCTFVNGPSGNAMEVGHELSVESVTNVRFEDIDVVSVHGHGAVFSIHNNDRAEVKGVVFENIHIEHCFDKFIDFRISQSRFSSDDTRGKIKDVLLKDIYWNSMPCNDGYTTSLIGGWDDTHNIDDVRIENLQINGTPITDINTLEIHTRYASHIKLIKDTAPLESTLTK